MLNVFSTQRKLSNQTGLLLKGMKESGMEITGERETKNEKCATLA
jgi:hypothetical protein